MSGYTAIDVDEDESGGLQFKTFLGDTETGGTVGSGGGGSGSGSGSGGQRTRADPAVPYSMFNLAYYESYFDVDTVPLLKRVGLAMVPKGGFIADCCDGQVDLYGPFWTLTTLILILYTTSTLTSSITAYLAGDPASTNIPLLGTATTLIYVYGLGIPAALWATTRWLGVGEWGPAEALAIYGYAMSVFIPVSLLCLIPIGIVRWVLVGVGALSSGFFLVTNIYPVLAQADNKMTRGLVIVVVVLHAALAFTMKILFYSYKVGNKEVIGPDDGIEAPVRRALEYFF